MLFDIGSEWVVVPVLKLEFALRGHEDANIVVMNVFEILEELHHLVEGNYPEVGETHTEGISIGVCDENHQEKSQCWEDTCNNTPLISLDQRSAERHLREFDHIFTTVGIWSSEP